MAAKKTNSGPIRWDFWLRWVLLTVAGWIIGGIIGIVLVIIVVWILGLPLVKLEIDAVLLIVIVAVMGLMQWLALRRIVQRAGFWAPASIIGFTIPLIGHGVLCYVYGYPDDVRIPLGAVLGLAVFIVAGTLIGVLQQRILRQHVLRSAWWVPASAAGWGLSSIGLGAPCFFLPENGDLYEQLMRNMVLPPVLASVILGIVTGGVPIWLLRRPIQQTPYTTT